MESVNLMQNKNDSNRTGVIDTKNTFKTNDADSYNTVADYFDQYTERFTRHMPGAMLEIADVPKNGKVLDVGTGTGVVAFEVVNTLGNQGHVTGIDLSDGMLTVAREKARQKGLEDRVKYLKMDAENLEFPDNSFDAALSLYALRHFPNPGKSVDEIFRVVKPGAHIVVAVGSRPSVLSLDGIKAILRRLGSIRRSLLGKELTACEFIDSLVEKHIPKKAGDEIATWVGEHHGFTGSIKELVREAGFESVHSDWRGQYSIIDSTEDFWLLQMTFSSLARKRIAEANQSIVDKIKDEFYDACEHVLKRNGRLVYQTGAVIVSGKKPLR